MSLFFVCDTIKMLLMNGARRVGKSYIVEEFARKNYKSYILIDFNEVGREITDLFDMNLRDLDSFFMYLSAAFNVKLYERESVLIFDEVITGFRLAFGGAQQRFGITPDMTTVGKIVGGGYPAAAFGGRADIMALLAPDGPVYQAGTLSGNPVAMAAGLETLHQLATPGFYDRLETRSSQFIAELQQIIRGKDIQLNHCGSMFTLFFNPDPVRNFADARRSDQEHFTRYFQRMLERGIYVSPSQFEGNFISECHTDDILEYVLKSIKESIA